MAVHVFTSSSNTASLAFEYNIKHDSSLQYLKNTSSVNKIKYNQGMQNTVYYKSQFFMSKYLGIKNVISLHLPKWKSKAGKEKQLCKYVP